VQILADTHGDVIYLFGRACSVQRRHQKVVELAPAPNISTQLRSRLCSDAVASAMQIGSGNLRIQVEHTVSECASRRLRRKWPR
jgi:pyruvate carboxylase